MLSLIGAFGAGLVQALGSTFSVSFLRQDYLAQARANGSPAIYTFWHEGLLLATFVFRHQGIRVLVSQHQDGEYISQTIERLGYTTVRGSTTRGGTRALFRMAAAGQGGENLGVTVDGPRGPRRSVQSGVLYIARRSGLPILPFAVACSRKRVLSSWDRFIVPLPFARVVVAFGEPLFVPNEREGVSLDTLKVTLEQRLSDATEVAEKALELNR